MIAFIETFCRVPEGTHVGEPMKLEPFQKRFVLRVYDNPARTRRAILSIARKNGKTALIAALVLVHVVGPEAIENSQVVSGAQSRDQAALVFKLAEKMVNLEPKLRERVRAVGKSLIGIRRNVEYRAIAAESTTALGLSPVVAILDELGQVRGPQDDFVDAIVTSQGAYESALLLVISTQAATDSDMLSLWIDDALTGADPQTVVDLHAAPDDADVMDRKAWKAANPALGKFRSLEDMQEKAKRAARMPSFESSFRNLYLNQRVQLESPFVSRSIWQACAGATDREAAAGSVMFAGLDLSARLDLTAFVIAALVGDEWHVFPTFWTPKDTLRDRAKRDRLPYDVWVDRGFIRAIPGKAIDLEIVATDIKDLCDELLPQAIAYDRWRIEVMKKEFERVAFDVALEPFGQGMKDMTPALDALEAILINGKLRHGGHPVLTTCAQQARVQRDAAGGRKLTKINSVSRIDGLVALAMAIGAGTRASASSEIEQGVVAL